MTYHFNMIAEDNFKTLCNLTTSLVGLRKGSLSCKSRKQEFQIPRSVVSVISRMIDETHPNVIAKVLKRDRVSVYKHQTTLRIKSGRIGIDIKVSYKDFYNQLENCKFALTDCNYNLEII